MGLSLDSITKYASILSDVPSLITGYISVDDKIAFVGEQINEHVDIPNITEENETRITEAIVELIEASLVCYQDYKDGDDSEEDSE